MSERAMARKGVLDGQEVVQRASAPRPKKAKATKPTATRPGKTPLRAPSANVWRGVASVLVLAFALAVVLCVLSFHPGNPHLNLIGRVGHALAHAVFEAVGVCAYLVPFPLFSLGVSLATSDPTKRHWPRLAALVVLALTGATLAHVIIGVQPGQAYPPGGWVGIHAGGLLEDYFGFWGAGLALCAIAASAIVVASEGWLVRAGVTAGRAFRAQGLVAGAWGWARLQEAMVAYRESAAQRKIERAEEAAYMKQVLAEEQAAQDAEDEADDEDEQDEAERDAAEADELADEADALTAVSDRNRGLTEAHASGDAEPSALAKRKVARDAPDQDPAWAIPAPVAAAPAAGEPIEAPKKKAKPAKAGKNGSPEVSAVPSPAEPSAMGETSPLPRIVVAGPKGAAEEVPFDEKGDVEVLAQSNPDEALKTSLPPQPALVTMTTDAKPAADTDAASSSLPAIIERPAPAKLAVKKKEAGGFEMAAGHTAFVLPPIEDVLEVPDDKRQLRLDKEVFFATAEKLRLKLKDFGIEGEVKEIHPGPVVTMYEFVPGPGIKISKIASLADDLAMAMEALRVRIVAPLPGRGSVGIEVPNKERETVYLKEIIESEKYVNANSKLTMCLGKNIEGTPFVMDLAKAPHLLIAGTTGSGKSVSVNSMIMSLLLKATPEELRFIMVDPKMLELSIYEGIPHLLLPVVTDSKKAALALQWAVDEMQRRYQLMSDAGVRNLAGYNKLIESGAVSPKPAEPKADARIVVDVAEGQPPSADAPLEAEVVEAPRKLPYIVVIIDELADLMMVASREVETSIARLAQMARAAGIHLMVATQRPSTDVVTGVIKANFPTRISFMLRSKPDSMTILGQNGAEALLGMGDMLVQPPTDAHVVRVHGAYVSEVEIKKVVDHLKQQGKPVYDESILKPREEEAGEGGAEEDDLSDELYDQALAIVGEMRDVSISVLQRKMRIGYNRSARMIERMERDGVVAAADGTKPRRVLIRPVGEMPGAGA